MKFDLIPCQSPRNLSCSSQLGLLHPNLISFNIIPYLKNQLITRIRILFRKMQTLYSIWANLRTWKNVSWCFKNLRLLNNISSSKSENFSLRSSYQFLLKASSQNFFLNSHWELPDSNLFTKTIHYCCIIV